jgi:Abortive infection C-terminus
MIQAPVSDEISIAVAAFFFGGAGPSHHALTVAAAGAGYGDDDPYSPATQTPNKQVRVQIIMMAAIRRPQRARELIDALLVRLRVHGCFDPARDTYDGHLVRSAQDAFRRAGWTLSDDGVLRPTGAIELATGGRPALDEQVERLRRSADDPGQLLGSAKDLLEAVAKFVLEEVGFPAPANADFNHLWHLARDRLGLLPAQVDTRLEGATSIETILQSSWNIADEVNKLRGIQGTGHGRTLPTGVTAEMALPVVREACNVAELALTTLDRVTGRR